MRMQVDKTSIVVLALRSQGCLARGSGVSALQIGVHNERATQFSSGDPMSRKIGGQEAVSSQWAGGALAVRTLSRAKVEVIFGLHGAHVEAIFQGCLDAGIKLVDTRHEAAAGHAAEGYARAGRRLGVAVVTAGPGFTNIVTSIANAAADRTPVLYLVGSAPLDDPESNCLQSGVNQFAVAAPMVKWAHRVARTADIPRLVAHAVRIATATPRGPVYLEIPTDVMDAEAQDIAITPQEFAEAAVPGESVVREILGKLNGAERPLILAGAPVYHGRGEEFLRCFAELSGIPVFTDFEALGTLPCAHRLYGGTLWQLPRLPKEVHPDLVLALGVRFGWDAPGFRETLRPRVIHVEQDAAEIGRFGPATLGVVADPVSTLSALCRAGGSERIEQRLEWAAAIKREGDALRERVCRSSTDGRIHPASAALVIRECIGPDTIVVADGAFSKHWLDDIASPQRPGSYLTHGRLGAMGTGMGLAIGAQFANPDRRVVLVTGDGSVGFNIAELDTMVRHSIPVVVIVMNNRGWGASRLLQIMRSGSGRLVGTALGTVRYDQIMAACGGAGYHVTAVEELRSALLSAMAERRAACIDIAASDEVEVPPAILGAMSR